MSFRNYLNPKIIRCRISQKAPYENFQKDKNYIFIHIPKAAGTSVSNALGLRESAHAHWVDFARFLGPRKMNRYFVFTFVRNPWARFFSLYNYARMERSHYHSNVTGESSLYGPHLDFETLKDASLRDCAHLLFEGRLRHDKQWNQWRPQVDWLRDDKGEIRVNYVGRVETLSKDMREIFATIGMSYSDPPKMNISNRADYREAYDDETAQLVAKYYAEDIEAFGYTFDDFSNH